MKTTIACFAIIFLTSPVFAASCKYPKQPIGTGNSLMTEFVTNNCKLTKEQRKNKTWCDTMKENARPRSCWAYYKDLK